MSQAILTPTPSPFLVAGTLDDAHTLQDEIRQLKENISIIQREVDRRQEQITDIIHEHLQAGIRQEGLLFIAEKPGRRSLDQELFQQVYPDEFKKVARVKLIATITDAERVLCGEEIEAVCTRAPSTFEIDVMLREVRR
jgi:hypothetical protein